MFLVFRLIWGKGGGINISVRRRRLAGHEGGKAMTFIFLDFFIFSL